MSTATFTKIECGECGGDYLAQTLSLYVCKDCGHGINPHVDIMLDEGEHLAAAYGVLGYYLTEGDDTL